MRENTYLVTGLMLLAFLLSWFGAVKVGPRIQRAAAWSYPIQLAQYTIMMLMVFVFLRPINQFIYFQF